MKEIITLELDRKTIIDDEKFLRQISLDVDFEKDNYLKWINMVKEYCKNHAVFALAPVQIGIPKRFIYLKNTSSDMNKNFDSNYDEGQILINPKIIETKGHTRFLEGCASCIVLEESKFVHLVGTVNRPYSIKIEYYNIKGEKCFKTLEGFESTVFSHEYDHLNGILHIDLADDVQKMNQDEMKAYRMKHPYEIISKEDVCVKRKIK